MWLTAQHAAPFEPFDDLRHRRWLDVLGPGELTGCHRAAPADAAEHGDIGGREIVIGDLLTQLTTVYPELKKHLYNEQGKLRHFVNIYVNDEDIRYLQKEETALGEKDTISIIPSVAGGSDAAVATPLPTLDQEEVARYSRHLILPEVGLEGQRKLKAASVL